MMDIADYYTVFFKGGGRWVEINADDYYKPSSHVTPGYYTFFVNQKGAGGAREVARFREEDVLYVDHVKDN